MHSEDQDNNLTINITKEEVNDLPLHRYDGPIKVIAKQEDLPGALEVIEKESHVGFDTETRPSFSKGESYPTALLQLACRDHVFLFQLSWLQNLDPLFSILEDPDLVKAGVAIRDDIRKLQDLQPFAADGFLEISEFSQRAGIVNTGLRSLAAHYLGIRVSKGAQLTNWNRKRLSKSQLIYAATDAWVSRLLYDRMRDLGQLAPNPPSGENLDSSTIGCSVVSSSR